MNRYLLLLLLGFVFIGVPVAFVDGQEDECDPQCAFRSVVTVSDTKVKVPTVVEVPLPDTTYGPVGVLETGAQQWVPTYVKETRAIRTAPFTIASDYGAPYPRLYDGDTQTYEQFALPDDTRGEVTFIVTFSKPVAISSLRLQLDDQVALPRSVSVSVIDREEKETIVAPTLFPDSGTLRFLRTTGSAFLVTFTYAQPLRITELLLEEDQPITTTLRAVRFLAQPGASYDVFTEADRQVRIVTGEAGDLVSDTGVRRLVSAPLQANAAYRPADVDNDGITDRLDNCVLTSNTDQVDIDDNGRGDACDDYDRDGRINSEDNCPAEPNRDQRDEDGDGVGDACDAEESRFTEQNAWIPWAGMGFAALVLVGLFALTLRRPVLDTK